MSDHSRPDDVEAFIGALRARRMSSARVVMHALDQASTDTTVDQRRGHLANVAHVVDDTLVDLDDAADELSAQSEALFEARIELEGAFAVFRDLFELAPFAYLVTNRHTRIDQANDAACALLRRAKNALVGKPLLCFVPLEERTVIRSAVHRALDTDQPASWPIRLMTANRNIGCRVRVRQAMIPGTRRPSALYWTITEETDEDLF